MLEQFEKNSHPTYCLCDSCKMKGVCKLEDFITYNLDTIEIPQSLKIICEYYTSKGYSQRD